MKAEIIAVGSELLTPDRMDTNSLFLTEELNKLGIEIVRKTIVGDNRELLAEAFRDALERVPLILASGGLGPTEDDLTRETVAELLHRKLILNEAILRYIEGRFRQLGREMPPVNARQAMVPEGAVVLENPRGSAPGLWLEDRGRCIALLPGPPRELKPMYLEQVLPRLGRSGSGVRMFHRELRVAGLGESALEQRIKPIYTRYSDVNTTILAAPGEIQIHLRMWTDDAAQAEKTLDEIVQGFELALTDRIYSKDGSSMEEVIAHLLTLNKATIAAAESCTGGLLAERLTSIAGSSSYFLGGVVCYSNDLKTSWANVPAELIQSKGAVSSEVAKALADGIRRRNCRAGRRQRREASRHGPHRAVARGRRERTRHALPGRSGSDSLARFATCARYGAFALPVQRRRAATTRCEKAVNGAPLRCAGNSFHGARKSRLPAKFVSRYHEGAALGARRESPRYLEVLGRSRRRKARRGSNCACRYSFRTSRGAGVSRPGIFPQREASTCFLGRDGSTAEFENPGGRYRRSGGKAGNPARKAGVFAASDVGAFRTTAPAGLLAQSHRGKRSARLGLSSNE